MTCEMIICKGERGTSECRKFASVVQNKVRIVDQFRRTPGYIQSASVLELNGVALPLFYALQKEIEN
jgi:hypothetical protein